MHRELAVVIVHYRAGQLLTRAVEAILTDLAASGVSADLVVVDNGSDDEERRAIEQLPVRRIATDGNPGYGAALNVGTRATSADKLFFMNPDVLLLPGCTVRLLEALESSATAGPRFYWDEQRRFWLPPTEQRSRRAELLRALASRSETMAGRVRRSWRRHARRHWLAAETLTSFSLSGALLAVRRDALERVGPFDDQYRLYFEEDDWLARLRRAGLRAVYVPEAEAVHLYAQSTSAEPAAGGWYAESKARFDQRYYGAHFARLLSRLGRPSSNRARRGECSARPELELPPAPNDRLWVEVSSTPFGFPAAAEVRERGTSGRWRLPEPIWQRLAPGRYSIRAVTGRGRELLTVPFVRPAEGANIRRAATDSSRGRRRTSDGDSEWRIRTYREGDEARILELFEEVFHQHRSSADWAWRYRENPYCNLRVSLAFDRDGRLGAHYGSYSCRFYDAVGAEPRIILANQIGDTMTSKAARREGVGRRSLLGRVMSHHFARFCERQVGFNYGFNEGKIQRYYTRLVPGSRFLEPAPYRVLSSKPTPRAGGSFTVRRIEAVDDRWDSLFHRAAPAYRLLVERDQKYLRWRYLSSPEVEYPMYGIFDRDRLLGWGVFRRSEKSLFWGDALFDPEVPEAAPRFLSEVQEIFGAAGENVEAWFPPRPKWWDRILVEMGFEPRPEPQDLGLIYKPFLEPDPMERFRAHLYYTKGDGDLL